MAETRIRRLDARRDRIALANLYAREDSDRGFLARCLLAELERAECICGEINARHCPVHNDAGPEADVGGSNEDVAYLLDSGPKSEEAV